jgi:hypothetical protein
MELAEEMSRPRRNELAHELDEQIPTMRPRQTV